MILGSAGQAEARIRGLALKCEHAEHTLLDASERLASDEPLECLDTECELAERERALAREATGAPALEVSGSVYSGP